MASAADIVRNHEYDPNGVEYLGPPSKREHIEVVPYDPAWPAAFEALAARLRAALGDVALCIEHVGSTSVPGLPAKPVIDIDLTVPDSRDEESYRPALEAAGLPVLFRERVFHEHRFAHSDSPRANIHIWSPDCPEAIRHRMLRDWLLTHPEERELYAAVKLASAEQINAEGGLVMDYNLRKQPVLRGILERMFRAQGLID
ncbi:GrpB family protein [Pyxidicoccus sp. 3LFB2]